MSTILPDFDQAKFRPGAPIDNPNFPLTAETVLSYRGATGEGEVESNDMLVSDATREIEGVKATVVRDTAYLDGLLVEDTFDWYAQDQQGNAWYLGELTFAYEFAEDGVQTDTEGSWEAGVEIDPDDQPGVTASPGFIMPSAEQLQAFLDSGDSYYQEFAPGIAEDEARVVSLSETVEIPGLGNFEDVLQTAERTALEPQISDFKYYAPGIGQIRTEELAEGKVDLTIDLQGIRDMNEVASDDPGQPERADFEGDGGAMWVTLIASDGDHALGAYNFSWGSNTLGEGSILFAKTDGLTAQEAATSIPVPHQDGLGLFLVPNGGELAELGLDLSAFAEGGLVFTNPLDFGQASLKDGLAPWISDGALNFEAPVNLPEFPELAEGEEEVFPLPLQVFHALDASRNGINPLNPAGGVQAIDLDWEGDTEVTVLGFEDQRPTDPEFDGDFNDLILAVSHDPLGEATIDQIVADLGIPEDTLVE